MTCSPSQLPARSVLAAASLLLGALLLCAPLAHADDYGFRPDYGSDFNGPNWDDDSANPVTHHVGPPGSGDNASIAGSTVTCEGGAVDSLTISEGCNFQLSGNFTATTFNEVDGTLSGAGILTAQTLAGVGFDIEGGNLVAATSAASGFVNGGSLNITNSTGATITATAGAQVTIGNNQADFNASCESGATLTVPDIVNGMDITVTSDGANSSIQVAHDFTIAAGFLNVTNGGSLKTGGELLLDGGTDSDGNAIGGGGGFTGAGTFVSITGPFSVGRSAPSPGFSLGMGSGAVLSSNASYIGENPGGYGIVTMTDAGTIWNVSGALAVGDQGAGELDLSTGAQLLFAGNTAFGLGFEAGGSGTVQADGAGTIIDARSALLSVGYAANADGNIKLTNGASLLLADTTYIGDSGSGSVTVSSGSNLQAGVNGTATYLFAVGNTAESSGNLVIIDQGSQLVTGSQEPMVIGYAGQGFASVSGGATAQTEEINLGHDPGGAGTMIVDGSGTIWTNNEYLDVGGAPSPTLHGTGVVTVSNSAQLRTSAARFGLFISAIGQVMLDGTGQVAVGAGAFGPAGSLRVSAPAVLIGKGRRSGSSVLNTNVTGNVIIGSGGRFRPGADPDVFSIQGNCDLSDGGANGGETDFELAGAGTAGSDYDELIVSGATTLGGTLKLVLLPGYTPKPGDVLALIKSGSVTGAFTQIDAPGLTVSQTAGATGLQVTITAVASEAPPAVSNSAATATVGQPFSYQITAANDPAGYGATSLPDGLSVDSATGLISGVPTTAGTTSVPLTATNVGGTGTGTLTLTVLATALPGSPVITSATTASGQTAQPFSYQITATNTPTTFAATGLPDGLAVDPASGLISGTPTTVGVYTVALSAGNAIATNSATLTLTIAGNLPLITLTAKVPIAGGASGHPAKFQLTRTGDLTQPLKVKYTIKGTAQNGADYTLIPQNETFKPGKATKNIKITPIPEPTATGKKTITLTLKPSPTYTIGTLTKVKVKIDYAQ